MTYPIVLFNDYDPQTEEQAQWLFNNVFGKEEFKKYYESKEDIAEATEWNELDINIRASVPRHYPPLIELTKRFIEKFGKDNGYLEIKELSDPMYYITESKRGDDVIYTRESLTLNNAAEFSYEERLKSLIGDPNDWISSTKPADSDKVALSRFREEIKIGSELPQKSLDFFKNRFDETK